MNTEFIPAGAPSHREGEVGLFERAKQGDRQAVAALLKCYGPAVERLCRRMCRGDDAAVEDVIQETYVAILRSLPDFRGDAGFLTWVYTIARTHRGRAARSAARERGRRESLSRLGDFDALEPPSPDEVIADREATEAYLGALEPLRPLDRRIVMLRDLEGLSAPEVAREVGLTVSAVKTRLHRARVTIRALLLERRGHLDA